MMKWRYLSVPNGYRKKKALLPQASAVSVQPQVFLVKPDINGHLNTSLIHRTGKRNLQKNCPPCKIVMTNSCRSMMILILSMKDSSWLGRFIEWTKCSLKKNHKPLVEQVKAVKFLRNNPFHPARLVAWVLRVSLTTLRGWNQHFDENLIPYEREETRGKSTKVTCEHVRQIVKLAKKKIAQKERIIIKSFSQEINNELEIDLADETIREILIANDVWAVNTRKRRPRYYQNLCQRIPNGLLSIDGSELEVIIDGEPHKYNLELGVDAGSFCHTGFEISKTETAKAVIAVLEQHTRDYGLPLGVVFDHGTANLSDEVKKWLREHDVEIVPAGPGNPEGNGTCEGAFSQLKELIGTITLKTSSPEKLGADILAALVSLYLQMRNKLSLRRNGVVPQAAMEVETTEQVRQKERERLVQHNINRQDSGNEQDKLETLHWIIEKYALKVDAPSFHRAGYSIKSCGIEAIRKTERAFIKAVDRNASRQNLAYFFGILHNIQQKIDDDQYQEYCREKYHYQSVLESEKQKLVERQEPKKPSFEVIVELAASSVGVSENIQKNSRHICKGWLKMHLKASGYVESIKKKIQDVIGASSELDMNAKELVWQWLEPLMSKKTVG